MRATQGIFDEHPGLQDRFIGTGRVLPELAAQLGLCGLAGRASGMAWDLRVAVSAVHPTISSDVHMATHRNGDVAARVMVRFEEVLESLELCRMILDRMPAATSRPSSRCRREGSSASAGWRAGAAKC